MLSSYFRVLHGQTTELEGMLYCCHCILAIYFIHFQSPSRSDHCTGRTLCSIDYCKCQAGQTTATGYKKLNRHHRIRCWNYLLNQILGARTALWFGKYSCYIFLHVKLQGRPFTHMPDSGNSFFLFGPPLICVNRR